MSNEAEIQPLFDVEDRGYRVRAFYLPEGLLRSNLALVYITHGSRLVSLYDYWAYRVWNIAAHFGDIVDDLNAGAE